MPVERGKDKNGNYFRWGKHGHKYYYVPNNKYSRTVALELCKRQGRAIEWRKHS